MLKNIFKGCDIAENINLKLNQEINYELVKNVQNHNIDDFIKSQLDSYNHFVGERGTKFKEDNCKELVLLEHL